MLLWDSTRPMAQTLARTLDGVPLLLSTQAAVGCCVTAESATPNDVAWHFSWRRRPTFIQINARWAGWSSMPGQWVLAGNHATLHRTAPRDQRRRKKHGRDGRPAPASGGVGVRRSALAAPERQSYLP